MRADCPPQIKPVPPLQGLPEALQRLGVAKLHPWQNQVTDRIMRGLDSLVVMPTGGGKSLCYQLPALLLRARGLGPTVVVSPLIALIEDQTRALQQRGIRALAWHSQLGAAEARVTYAQVRAGACDLLFMAPERAVLAHTQEMWQSNPPALLAIDEAHCISHWGHDFRPAYRLLADLRRSMAAPCVALTATATREVITDITRSLALLRPALVRGSSRRDNLALHLRPVAAGAPRIALLKNLLREHGIGAQPGRAIVYAATRKRVEAIACSLRDAKIVCAHYHAGMADAARAKAQSDFAGGGAQVMVATQAFGMGINHPDVRLVVHMQAPGSLGAYAQEVGRAGRDGADATCMLFYAAQDWAIARQLIGRGTGAAAAAGRASLAAMMDFCRDPACRQVALARYFLGPDAEAAACAPCGRCDICVGMPRAARATPAALPLPLDSDAAKLMMAAAHALTRPVGVALLVSALRGSRAQTVQRRGLLRLAQHGALAHVSAAVCQATAQALLARGDLVRRGQKYPTVWPANKPVRMKSGAGRDQDGKKSRGKAATPLLRALQAFCRREAKALGYRRPYMVLSRQMMADIIARPPTKLAELEAIKGIGKTKLSAFGTKLLTLVHQHRDG